MTKLPLLELPPLLALRLCLRFRPAPLLPPTGSTSVEAANHEPSIESQSWSFTGPFGVYNNAQLQRGFLVYKTICANCHSLRLLSAASRRKRPTGISPDEVKAIAAEVQVTTGRTTRARSFSARGGRLSVSLALANDAAARAAESRGTPSRPFGDGQGAAGRS